MATRSLWDEYRRRSHDAMRWNLGNLWTRSPTRHIELRIPHIVTRHVGVGADPAGTGNMLVGARRHVDATTCHRPSESGRGAVGLAVAQPGSRTLIPTPSSVSMGAWPRDHFVEC